MSRGILDCATGSGITTQVSSNWTMAGRSSSSSKTRAAVWRMGISSDGEQDMVVVVVGVGKEEERAVGGHEAGGREQQDLSI